MRQFALDGAAELLLPRSPMRRRQADALGLGCRVVRATVMRVFI